MPDRKWYEGRSVCEEPSLSRKFSHIAGDSVRVYVDNHPVVGRQFPVLYKGRFIMVLKGDTSRDRAWVREHFQKMRGDWYRKVGRKKMQWEFTEPDRNERRFLDDFAEHVGDIADKTIVKRPVSVVVNDK